MSSPAPRTLTGISGTPGGFAWHCRKPVTGPGGQIRECDAGGGDREEYERHMRGHGLKTAKARTPPRSWKPPRPKDYAPGPDDPGQRIQWQHDDHHGNTRTVTGVIWSPADRPGTWWAQPDDDPARPVYVIRYRHGATLHQVDGAAESARENIIRGNIIRGRGIYPVLTDDGEPCVRWHSDPGCPHAAGRERYDPGRHGQLPGYTCDGYRPWTALDVGRELAASFQRKPPWLPMCPDCVTSLDITAPEPAPAPGNDPREQEPPAAGQAPARPEPARIPAAPATGGDRPAPPPASTPTARPPVRLGAPATDTEFLASCAQLGEVLTCLAAQAGEWAAGLAALGLPPPVTGPLRHLAGSLAEAAAGPSRAAAAFEDEFAAARDTAARGLRFTGSRPR